MNRVNKCCIGWFGYGNLGNIWVPKLLSLGFQVMVNDTVKRKRLKIPTGAQWGTRDEVAQQDIVVLGIPLGNFRGLLRLISSKLKPTTVLINPCGNMLDSNEIIEQYVPDHVQYLNAHALYGQSTAHKTRPRKKVVLALGRVQTNALREVRTILTKLNHVIIETTPELHDQAMAEVLAIPHLQGWTLHQMGIERSKFATANYRRVIGLKEAVTSDSWSVAISIMANRYAPEVINRFKMALDVVLLRIEKGVGKLRKRKRSGRTRRTDKAGRAKSLGIESEKIIVAEIAPRKKEPDQSGKQAS